MLPGPNTLAPPADAVPRKRRRGAHPTSCAECRRLKLKCSRTVPCTSCVKRGCGAICPEGSLTTGQGNRFVLASTEELHDKITQLGYRVRTLEDALRESHAARSPEPHPLLADDLLRIKQPLEREPRKPGSRDSSYSANTHDSSTSKGSTPDVVGPAGHYEDKFLFSVPDATPWSVLQNDSEGHDQAELDDRFHRLSQIVHPDVLSLSGAFPLSLTTRRSFGDEDDRLQQIVGSLPPASHAVHLSRMYYQYAAWCHNPIPQADFQTDVFSTFYSSTFNWTQLRNNELLCHRLSVLYMVLAVGCTMDPAVAPHSLEAEKYHQLARAALFLTCLSEHPTMSALQALFLIAIYLFMDDPYGEGAASRWLINGMTVKLAQSIGLHRETGLAKLDRHEAQRRRELFWEMHFYDSCQALPFGRPPSFARAHVDTRQPFDEDCPAEQAFYQWKHRFDAELAAVLHDEAFGCAAISYADVLRLDRALRAFPIPPILQITAERERSRRPEPASMLLQRYMVYTLRELNLVHLHRGWFSRAVNEHPEDPVGSPFGTSVLAAYRSCGSLVSLIRNLYAQLKHPTDRLWVLWCHLFSCVIILESIVTHCPSSNLAQPSLQHVDSACELFAQVAPGFRAKRVLAMMTRLRQRAHHSMNSYRAGQKNGATPEPLLGSWTDVDELASLTHGAQLGLYNKVAETPRGLPAQGQSIPPGLNAAFVSNYLPAFASLSSQQESHPAFLRTLSPMGSGPLSSLPPLSASSSSPLSTSGTVLPSFPQFFGAFDFAPSDREGTFTSYAQNSHAGPSSAGSADPRSSGPTLTAWNDFVGYENEHFA